MDDQEVNVVYKEMDEITQRFLEIVKPKLQEQFSTDKCSMYLNKMVEHLETFYNDVVYELELKKERAMNKIEALQEEASEMKKSLNVDFELVTNDNNELPLSVYLERLDNDLMDMRELYQRRKEEIENCLEQQEALCKEMEEPLRSLALNPLASEYEVATFQEYLIDLKSEKLRRRNEIENLRRNIEAICDEIEVPMNNSIDEHTAPTTRNINFLSAELETLQKMRESIKRDCEHLINKLESLWECLDTPLAARMKYRNLAQIYKQSTLNEIEEELKRCKVIKQENIKLFVDKLREQIVAQWDKIHRSEAERQKFTYFQAQIYTEDLLELHEIELEECKRFYDENRVIFEKFAERKEWWSRMIELEEKQKDSNRYNNRGGQLLREEKERKKLNMKLPGIEAEIHKLVEDYRANTGREFLINGESIVEVMERDWEKMRQSKEQLKSARKGNGTAGQTPRSVIPATPRTPMSIRGQTTMKRLASSTNLAAASGNTGKKIQLEVPGRTNNVSSMSTSKKNQSRLPETHFTSKRNLFGSNTPSRFVRPTQSARKVATLKLPTLSLPRRRSNGLLNISASKIVRKYRRSNAKRVSQISTSDESVVNYDVFQTHMKTTNFTNSSVVGTHENREQIHTKQMKTPTQTTHTRTILGTPNRTNVVNNITRSPVLSASAKKLKTKNLALII